MAEQQELIPTTVNPIPADPNPGRITAPELDDAIIARPLVSPDFTNPEPKDPNVQFRWIEFKARDGFRFQQCLTQGFKVATIQDLKHPEKFAVYAKEAGTKFINGDVILMKIDKGRYLGALKHRYLRTQAMTDPAVARAVSQASADQELKSMSKGKMSAFAPEAADLSKTGVNINQIPGVGGTPGVEKATGTDIRSGK
jgi:hypothetical protein